MRAIQIQIPAGSDPLYLRIAGGLRQALQRGLAKAGEKLPSTRELSETLGTHRNTVIAALAELVAEGWIRSEERKSYVVSSTPPSGYFSVRGATELKSAKAFHWDLAVDVGMEQLRPQAKVRYAFRWGFPDLSKFPYDEFRSHYLDVLRRPSAALFDYGSPLGHPALRAPLEEYLRRMRGIEGRSVFVMNGAGEGMFLACQVLLKPGDTVAMEEPGYPAALEMFRVLGAKVIPIPVEKDGIDVEALAKAAKTRKIKMVFVTPLHQFPTTVTLTAPKRLRLYEIASKFGMAILEDDYDHEFHYRTQPLAPLAAADPEGRVIHTGTFSKVLFPSIRIGFLAVPKPLERPISQLRRLTVHQNDVISQDALARWMQSGGMERHLRRMRRLYHAKRDAMEIALQAARDRGARWEWSTPDGGSAFWVNVGTDSRRFAEKAAAKGIFVSPEHLHRATHSVVQHVRLGFTTPNFDDIRDGIAELGKISKEAKAVPQ